MRKIKRRFRWDRLALCLMLLIVVVVDLWIAFSYVDIVTHNTTACPAYQHWNFFITMFQ